MPRVRALVRTNRMLQRSYHVALVLALGCGPASPTTRPPQPQPVQAEGPPPQQAPSRTQPTVSGPEPGPSANATSFLDPSSQQFASEIEAFEAADRQHPPAPGGTLFVGSSSIRLWQSLERDFAEFQALNRGFGGSRVRNVFDYADRIVIPYRPRRIVFFAGTNDIHEGVHPLQVSADFEAFVKRVWTTLPETPIAFVSITTSPDRFAEVARVKEANRLIKSYIATNSRLAYIDVFSEALKPDGTPNEALYANDGLHPNEKGYAVWTKVLRAFLSAQQSGVAAETKHSPAK